MGGKVNSIEDLPGIGPATIQKLKEIGKDNLMSIAAMDASELAQFLETGEKTANKIILAARNSLDLGFETGMSRWKERQKLRKITTGSKALNELLGGGIETQSITELYGEFGCGKTQLAIQLSVNVQMSLENNGLNSGVIFIDTENTFVPERVRQIAEAQKMDPDEVLENIYVGRAYNSDHQVLLAQQAEKVIREKKIGLVVVDSLTSHFRSDYVGRGELAGRQQKINRHMHSLQRLALTYNLAVVVTNQVMARPDLFFGDPTSPIGGHIVGHQSTFRIYLRKGKKGTRVARLVDSPYLPEGEAVFKVTEKGIEDVA